MIHSVRCQVLNVTYKHLGYISAKRGLRLLLDNKASLVEEHPEFIVNSERDMHAVPIRIVLNYLVKERPHKMAQLSNRNLFLRDNYICQYCGRHQSELTRNEMLTRDHIHPQDKGGLDEWKNVITACNKCNNLKANTILEKFEELHPHLRLKKKPTAPTHDEITARAAAQRNRR